jgi:hypothetical protein
VFFPGLAYPAPAPFPVDKSSKHLPARPALTPHDVAISRATDAAKRLDEYLLSVRGTGTLKEFNRAYKLRREAAAARGEGFMSFKTA